MLTAEQQAKLNAMANGTATCERTVSNVQFIQVREGADCPETCNIGETQQTVPIDVSKANQAQCGIVTFYIDRSSTSDSGDRQLTLGGCITTVELAQEFYSFPSTPLFSESTIEDQIGANEANYAGNVFLPFADCQLENKNMTFSALTAENTGDQTAFDTFRRGKIRTASMDMENSWGVCKSSRKSILCGPCENDDTTASWRGFMGISGHSALSINIPAGLEATLTFCVYNYEGARNITVC